MILYYESGAKMADVPYVNGIQNGLIKTYFEDNGALSEKVEVTNGKRNGKYVEYDKTGKLISEATYKNNELNGDLKLYYENNNIMAKVPYKNDTISGEALAYDRDGNKLYSMNFANNKPEGTRTAYYPNGKIKYIKNYKNGIWDGKSYKEYDENGQLMYEISDDGYSATYRKNNGTGTMIIMPNEEKEALLKRIDNRKAEKKDLEMLKQMKPQQIDFF